MGYLRGIAIAEISVLVYTTWKSENLKSVFNTTLKE